eukprot:CAMPEP_0171199264 /NCGR_PEP_ID=MMETSP0790-20130122/23375_1 /TAXON_ID=2925 /ORGANISM="Alexandrium catenella, Strain OF101" /LENGTH=254 /DNA_ID=CAMNT_0011664607 /DNA_START=235 /DNA_END=1000 /DNA_ORIENTATION=+
MLEGLHVRVPARLRGWAEKEELLLWHCEGTRLLGHATTHLGVDLRSHREGLPEQLPRTAFADEVAPEAWQPPVRGPELLQGPLELRARLKQLATVEAEVAYAPVSWEQLEDSVELVVKLLADACQVVLENQRPPARALNKRLPCLPVRQRTATATKGEVEEQSSGVEADGGPLLLDGALRGGGRLPREELLVHEALPVQGPAVHRGDALQGAAEPGVGRRELLHALSAVLAPVEVDEEADAVAQPRMRRAGGFL